MVTPSSLHGGGEDPGPLGTRGKYPPTKGSGDGDDPNTSDCTNDGRGRRKPSDDEGVDPNDTDDNHDNTNGTNERPPNSAATDKNVLSLAASARAGQSSSDLWRR